MLYDPFPQCYTNWNIVWQIIFYPTIISVIDDYRPRLPSSWNMYCHYKTAVLNVNDWWILERVKWLTYKCTAVLRFIVVTSLLRISIAWWFWPDPEVSQVGVYMICKVVLMPGVSAGIFSFGSCILPIILYFIWMCKKNQFLAFLRRYSVFNALIIWYIKLN